jgi:hypothetical protein
VIAATKAVHQFSRETVEHNIGSKTSSPAKFLNSIQRQLSVGGAITRFRCRSRRAKRSAVARVACASCCVTRPAPAKWLADTPLPLGRLATFDSRRKEVPRPANWIRPRQRSSRSPQRITAPAGRVSLRRMARNSFLAAFYRGEFRSRISICSFFGLRRKIVGSQRYGGDPIGNWRADTRCVRLSTRACAPQLLFWCGHQKVAAVLLLVFAVWLPALPSGVSRVSASSDE